MGSDKIKKLEKQDEMKLCYVTECLAYFTSLPLENQWGDDWDDVPYEYNAGPPYHDEGSNTIKIMAYMGDFLLPCSGYINSPYSVEDINKGKVPWLRTFLDNFDFLLAGATVDEFIDFVKRNGGRIFKEI